MDDRRPPAGDPTVIWKRLLLLMTLRIPGGPSGVDEYVEHNQAELDRRPVSRRTLLRGAAGSLGALALFPSASAAFAAGGGTQGTSKTVISGRHLAWISDRAGEPTNGMRVTAQLISPTGKLPSGLRAVVEVGTSPGSYGHRYQAEIVHLLGAYAIENGPIGSQFYVKADLTGLAAGGLYHYRFRLSDGACTGDAFFSTAPSRVHLGTSRPAPAAFTFTAFADVGTNVPPTDPKYALGSDPAAVVSAGGVWPKGVFDNNYYAATDPVAGTGGTDATPAITQSALMRSQRPAFTLLAGDICYADPSGSGLPANNKGLPTGTVGAGQNAYDPYVWDVFLNQIDSAAAYSPWMFATGNHDMEALYSDTSILGGSRTHGYAGHQKRLDLPQNGPHTCPSVYSFTYANVGVISVDANDLSAEIQTNTGYSDGAQLAWIEKTLKHWRTDDKDAATIDFVVAFFHHCAYSTTLQHASDGGVRHALDSLFTKYQVDLAIQGHNHVFERSDPIRNGKKSRSAPDGSTIKPAEDGVTYVTVGSGGRPRYQFQPAPSSTNPPPAGVTASGPQALPEGQRYRGYKPAGGANSKENNTENVVNSYVWSAEGTTVNASGYPQGTKVAEDVDWSQVRYDNYAFIAVDIAPARRGERTTLTVRTLADGLPGTGQSVTEIDRITMARTAGLSKIKNH
jgi:hypothetical protein